jgi:teichuronic acid biosynthesis protein TuaE
VIPLPGLEAIGSGRGLLVAGPLVALVLWLSWRHPAWVLLVALASFAIRPEILWDGPGMGYEWGLHHTLLALALVVNGARHGIRSAVNWPLLALIATLALSLAFGDLHPELTLPFMLMSLAILALPFTVTQVNLAPGSRHLLAPAIAAVPLLSVAIGLVLELASIGNLFWGAQWGLHRLQGATGHPTALAFMAVAGLAVAAHEWARGGRAWAPCLALANLLLIILSGTRMAIFASAVFLLAYALISPAVRALLRTRRLLLLVGGGATALTLVLYWPILQGRLFSSEGGIGMSGREEVWPFYLEQVLLSPIFGRGPGAGFIAGADLSDGFPVPHNEYLHLLVIGGVVGAALCLAGIGLWYRQLLRASSPDDRELLLALIPALAVYAMTDNVWFYWSVLPLYAYLGLLATSAAARDEPACFGGTHQLEGAGRVGWSLRRDG